MACKSQACKDNAKKQQDAWRKANRERVRARDAALRSKPETKRRLKSAQLKYLYGITIEDYQKLFVEQGGRCAICKIHQSELKRALVVDHDHETDEVRGLLCPQCNKILGDACDEVPTLLGAIDYLQRS